MVQSDIVTVTVDGVPPEECPYPLEGPVFQNFLLKCEAWETGKSATRVLRNVDMNLLLSASMSWSITYIQGNEIEVDGHIYLNDQRLESVMLAHWDDSESGTIDLTGLIKSTNDIKITMGSMPVTWCELSFDVWITLCFSEEPEEPPEIEDEDEGFIDKNLKWLALGGGAVALALLISRKGPQVVVIRE